MKLYSYFLYLKIFLFLLKAFFFLSNIEKNLILVKINLVKTYLYFCVNLKFESEILNKICNNCYINELQCLNFTFHSMAMYLNKSMRPLCRKMQHQEREQFEYRIFSIQILYFDNLKLVILFYFLS